MGFSFAFGGATATHTWPRQSVLRGLAVNCSLESVFPARKEMQLHGEAETMAPILWLIRVAPAHS
jgi:hypothetical protein